MAKKKKGSTAAKKKRVTVSFTWSGLFSTAVLIVLSIVWAFILGILVGRGYSPDSLFPKLAGLLPQSEAQVKEQGPGKTASKEGEEVLKPEELGFFESLQQQGARGSDRRKPSGQAEAKQARQASEHSAPTGGEPSGPVYRYVYQVAAFRSASKASELQETLRAEGIRSEMAAVQIDEREWYRIVVSFKGPPGQTSHFKAQLKRLGLHQPLLRSKKRLGSQ